MTDTRRRRQRLALVGALAVGASLAAWVTTPRRPAAPSTASPSTEIVLVLAGDAAVSVPLDLRTPGLQAIAAVGQRASLGIANFELAAAVVPSASPVDAAPRWPSATPEAAGQLRALGIGAVSLANNHAFDSGAPGLAAVQAQLAAAGVAHAGAGANLEAARDPAYVHTPGGTVALVAATLSSAAGARATARRGEINGRPGVHALRFSRRLTVDAAGLRALADVFPPEVLRPNAEGAWDLLGMTVARGEPTGMVLTVAAEDLEGLVAAVREARRRAAAVVVSLHAHEPGNRVDAVPDLLRTVAHAAIDAGADVIHGHGPHRLRGIEIHRGRPILYSLGNLVFPDREIRAAAADEFEDHARDALSPLGLEGTPQVDFEDDEWWQGAMAVVRLANGAARRVEVHPLDLGVGQPVTSRGIPALAGPPVGAAILERVRQLSAPLGAQVTIVDGVGVVTGSSQ